VRISAGLPVWLDRSQIAVGVVAIPTGGFPVRSASRGLSASQDQPWVTATLSRGTIESTTYKPLEAQPVPICSITQIQARPEFVSAVRQSTPQFVSSVHSRRFIFPTAFRQTQGHSRRLFFALFGGSYHGNVPSPNIPRQPCNTPEAHLTPAGRSSTSHPRKSGSSSQRRFSDQTYK